MRKSSNGHAWLLAPVLVLATACGDVLDNVPPRPVAIEDPTVADAAFPNLATVPARPHLTYSLEQRREIVDGLVADRTNARHAGDSLRQALDRPVQPDTAPPLPQVVPASPAASDPEGDLSLAFLEETLARDSDDGSLGDFLDRLQQPPPAVAEIRPSSNERPADATAGGPLEVSGGVAAPPQVEVGAVSEPAGSGSLGATAETTTAPALVDPPVALPVTPPVEATPAGPSLPLSIHFQVDAPDLGGQEHDELRRLARDVASGESTIVVSGGGERAGLAMERARRVAAILVEGGLVPGRIAIEMGGENNVVVVYEADA